MFCEDGFRVGVDVPEDEEGRVVDGPAAGAESCPPNVRLDTDCAE